MMSEAHSVAEKLLQKLQVIEMAIKSVPVFRYAVGAFGLIAMIGIAKLWGLESQAAVFGVVGALVSMVALMIVEAVAKRIKETKGSEESKISKIYEIGILAVFCSFVLIIVVSALVALPWLFLSTKKPADQQLAVETSPVPAETLAKQQVVENVQVPAGRVRAEYESSKPITPGTSEYWIREEWVFAQYKLIQAAAERIPDSLLGLDYRIQKAHYLGVSLAVCAAISSDPATKKLYSLKAVEQLQRVSSLFRELEEEAKTTQKAAADYKWFIGDQTLERTAWWLAMALCSNAKATGLLADFQNAKQAIANVPKGFLSLNQMSWEPDGKWVTSREESDFQSKEAILESSSDNSRKLAPDLEEVSVAEPGSGSPKDGEVLFAPDPEEVLVAAGRDPASPPDGDRKLAPEPEKVRMAAGCSPKDGEVLFAPDREEVLVAEPGSGSPKDGEVLFAPDREEVLVAAGRDPVRSPKDGGWKFTPDLEEVLVVAGRDPASPKGGDKKLAPEPEEILVVARRGPASPVNLASDNGMV
jgi:hypothetical protein